MTAEHIPDIVLERYRLNELPPAEAARMAEEIRRDSRLQQRLAALEESDEALRGQIQQVRARLAEHRTPGRARAIAGWPIPTVVAALCVFLVVAMFRPSSPELGPFITSPPSDAPDRIKGTAASGRPSLAVYRRTNEGSEQLADGDVAHPGDLIRVGYRAAGHPFGVIVSIDGRGAVTMHLPPAGDRAVALKSDPTVLLDEAYELDDAPRWERFYFVAGETAFDAAPVMQAAREAAKTPNLQPPGDLKLPGALEQAGFTLQKESRR